MESTAMGQDPTPTSGQDPINPGQDPAPTTEPGAPAVKTFDESYVKELRQEAAAYRTELQRIKEEREEAERKRLEEQGKFKELYEAAEAEKARLAAEAERLKAFETEVTAQREAERAALIEQLPEDMRTAFATATADQIRVVLTRISASGGSPTPNPPTSSRQTPPSSQPTAKTPGQSGWLQDYLTQHPR